MKIVNKSRKIIGINGEPLLPGADMEIIKEIAKNPVIEDYLKRGVIADVNKAVAPSTASTEISDAERAKIAEEAIAKYKAEQEAIAKAEAAKKAKEEKKAEAEKKKAIKEVESMDKDALANKAIGMGLEVHDTDTTDTLKEKILNALNA